MPVKSKAAFRFMKMMEHNPEIAKVKTAVMAILEVLGL